MLDVTVTLTEQDLDDILYEISDGSEVWDKLYNLKHSPPAQPAEPTALERLEAWLLTHVAELGIATLIADTAGFGVHLTNPERRVKMVFAPTLAAAIDAALEQAQEGKP